ncbi:MAG: relaxase/mobilization nuclease domain-containing protein, partial [Pseudomonadota bacterium]
MLFVGNQRGGARDLARHLMSQDNDHVEIHEMRGFALDRLQGAFLEAHDIAKGTKCSQFLYSLSVNPPPKEEATTRDFEEAIDRAEARLGLEGQPRAIVFHEKNGRRHAHAVWSRIDADEMKAVSMSHDRVKLQEVSKALYREHGWRMPDGMVDRSLKDPTNFTLAEWRQAKRAGHDPRDVKTVLQDAWAV